MLKHLLLALLLFCSNAFAQAPYVIFIGDSITQNWNLDLYFTGAANKGIYGNTTAQMLARFAADVVTPHPQYTVILGGTNDVSSDGQCTQCVTYIRQMVQMAQQAGIKPIVGLIPPRVWAVNPYNAALRQMGVEEGIEIADFFNPFLQASGNMRFELFQEGVNNNPTHPNDKGYAIMAPIVRPLLQQASPVR